MKILDLFFFFFTNVAYDLVLSLQYLHIHTQLNISMHYTFREDYYSGNYYAISIYSGA